MLTEMAPLVCKYKSRFAKAIQQSRVFQGAKERNLEAAICARNPFHFHFQSRSVKLIMYVKMLGPMGPEAKVFLLKLGWRLRQQTGEPRSTSFLLQQISMPIQKGNAIAIMGSIPQGKEPGELLEL